MVRNTNASGVHVMPYSWGQKPKQINDRKL